MTPAALPTFVHDLFAHMPMVQRLSLACIGGGALLLMALERVIPYNQGQRFLREGFFDDFAMYTIAQNYVLSIIIFSGIIARVDGAGGFSRLQLVAHWPLWLQVTFFVVTHDLYIYWMHRWQHRNRYLWRLHEAHHSPASVDWLSGSRSHFVEILINQTVEFAPIVLLGAAPAVIPIKGAISAVWGMYIHANLNVRTGRLQWIINGPEMHRWHHAKGKGMGANYSTKLAIWDWMFGTAYFPAGQRADDYGVRTWFPTHYLAQTLYAFRRFHRQPPASPLETSLGRGPRATGTLVLPGRGFAPLDTLQGQSAQESRPPAGRATTALAPADPAAGDI